MAVAPWPGAGTIPGENDQSPGSNFSLDGILLLSIFLKNHAKAILACDFFVAVTATFRMLYVFVVIEHGTRRLAYVNVTAHPSADWTLQQLRAVVAGEGGQQYLIHDRDKIFARHLDESISALGMKVLRSPIASPKANSICERVIGTIRRECLDWMIPLSEAHLYMSQESAHLVGCNGPGNRGHRPVRHQWHGRGQIQSDGSPIDSDTLIWPTSML